MSPTCVVDGKDRDDLALMVFDLAAAKPLL
jgi:hypothetical protein